MIGVTYIPGRWRASIKANGKRKFLGEYCTKEKAEEARLAANKKYKRTDNKERDKEITAMRKNYSAGHVAYYFKLTVGRINQILRESNDGSRFKDRDKEIFAEWMKGHQSFTSLGSRYNLSTRRIYQIVEQGLKENSR